MSSSLSQLVKDELVYKKHSTDRGNGLFAATDIEPRAQLLFVARPLLMVLDTARLQSYCDYCFRSPFDNSMSSQGQDEHLSLKRCTGCNILRFCGRQCQRHAWSQYHKFECKIYAKQPGTLPTLNRAILRLLKQHEACLLPNGEWEDLHTLKDHYEDLLQAGGSKWQDLLLIARKIQRDSGGKSNLESVLRLVCLVVVNSFTLTNPTFDPIGLALHPKSALFNHSCNPNAFVRFDISLASEVDVQPRYGSISVHAQRPISKDEELTISYIDTTSPLERRRRGLKERYFFDCSCNLCAQGPTAVLDRYSFREAQSSGEQRVARSKELKDLEATVEQYIERTKAMPGLEHQQVGGLKDAMRKLAATHNWSLHRYPGPQLRKLLFLGLVGLEQFDAALMHSGILLRRVYPVIYRDEQHPVRLIEMWTFFQLCRNLLGIKMSEGNAEEADKMATLGCAALSELAELIDVPSPYKGQFEHLVESAEKSVKSEAYAWGKFADRLRTSAPAWAWLEGRIEHHLLEEEGFQHQELRVPTGQCLPVN